MTVVRQDTFTRANVASGFGTATDGNTWTIQSGNGQSVASNEGEVISSTASTFATLGAALSTADCEGLVRFQVKDVTHNTAGILLRWTDASNHWLARYNGAASPSAGINVMVKVAGTYTSQATIAKSLTNTNFYWLRFNVQGTTISLRCWQDGTTEPGTWDGQYTLTSQNVAGAVGLYGFASGGNATFYDSFSVTDLSAPSGTAVLTGHGTLVASGVQVVTGAATLTGRGSLVATPQGVTPGTGIGDLAVTTPSLAWSGGPTGSPGTETRVTYVDSQNSGWAVGLVPTYGGMPISPVYSVDSGTATQETSLSTSNPDGHIHWLEQNPSAVFGGSEDVKFTLSELAPTATAFRRFYQAVGNAADGLGFTWTSTACIYPGDPGLIAYRFDLTNPGGAAIALNATDSLEVALLAGLEQADTTWAPANGGYGTIAGSDTVGWPSTLTTIEPDYVYIAPAGGGNTTLGQATVKKTSLAGLGWTSLQIQELQNTSRLKVKVQGSFASFAAGATQTIYALQVLRRNITAADVRAIAADYLASGTPTASVGSYTTFSYDERAYVFAASGNRLTATLSMSGTGVSARYKPVLKVTSWTNTSAPIVTWGGAALVAGTDYRYTIDSTNHVLYLQLYFDVVASGPAFGQRNNAALDVQPSITSGAATLTGHGTLAASGVQVLSGVATLTGHGTLVASGTTALSGQAVLTGHGTLVAAGVQVLAGQATLTGHGTLVADGATTSMSGAATLTGRGALLASGYAVVSGATIFTGRGTLVASGSVLGLLIPGTATATTASTSATTSTRAASTATATVTP